VGGFYMEKSKVCSGEREMEAIPLLRRETVQNDHPLPGVCSGVKRRGNLSPAGKRGGESVHSQLGTNSPSQKGILSISEKEEKNNGEE